MKKKIKEKQFFWSKILYVLSVISLLCIQMLHILCFKSDGNKKKNKKKCVQSYLFLLYLTEIYLLTKI